MKLLKYLSDDRLKQLYLESKLYDETGVVESNSILKNYLDDNLEFNSNLEWSYLFISIMKECANRYCNEFIEKDKDNYVS